MSIEETIKYFTEEVEKYTIAAESAKRNNHIEALKQLTAWKEHSENALIALKEKQEREKNVEQLDGYSFEVGV